jgi:threonine synthase
MTCNLIYEISDKYLCDKCGGILEVKHDYHQIKKNFVDVLQSPPLFNIWRYKDLLPVSDSQFMISLFEGGTPLVRSTNLSKIIGLKELFFKDESRNPSGAFKDRPIAVGISKAKEFGINTVATASSGNAAASLATYAAKADSTCYIFIPEHTPPEKVIQALVNGGNIVKVRGDYSNAFSVARKASQHFHWMNITTTFLNPYAVEGDKTIAYELYSQLENIVPDWIFVPTGAGPLLFGIYKGFLELQTFGLVDKSPRMVAVQAEGCSPVVRAFNSGTEHVSAWESPNTVASAIADPLKGYEQDGELILRILRESNGKAISVSDKEIIESVFEMAEHEGIYAEPAAATPYAALKKLIEDNSIDKSENVVCIVTGHGLKDPMSIVKTIDVPVIEPNMEAVAQIIV